MIRLLLLLVLPCINGQGFQSSITPNWGQVVGSAANQERLLASLITRGWTPPADVQRELATAARVRQTVTGGRDEFGNRFNFGFTPEQLMAPGLSIDELIPTNNGGSFGNIRDPGAANSLASLPNNMQIPGSLTQGLVNRGLLDPTLVNPNLAGRGLIDPTLQGTGFIDPTLQGRGIADSSLAEAALLGRQRMPGMVNILPDGGPLGPGVGQIGLGRLGPGRFGPGRLGPGVGPIGLGRLGPGVDPIGLGRLGPGVDTIGLGPLGPDPLDPIGPGVIGIAGRDHHGHDDHNDHSIKAVKGELVKNKIIKKKLKKELKARKQIKKEQRITKKILRGKGGIGGTNGQIVQHGDHFHLDDKILKVVGSTRTHHHPPPPLRRDLRKRKNPVSNLVTGLLLGGLGALLGGK